MSEARSTNSQVRIGILGSGWMGSVHGECYQRIKGARVVGIFSRNRERSEALAQKCGAKAVSDAYALLEDPVVDAIDVCVPTANHAEFVVKALEHRKHVFCESPFALRLIDSEAMLEAAKQAGRIFLVGLLERSIAQYEHVLEAAAAGHLGKVSSITTYRLGSYLLSEETRKHYADPALELMTLDFDFIRWMIGPPTSVYATALERQAEFQAKSQQPCITAPALAQQFWPAALCREDSRSRLASAFFLRKVLSSSRSCSKRPVRRKICFSFIPTRVRNS
jgi:predicted dehydrogenase